MNMNGARSQREKEDWYERHAGAFLAWLGSIVDATAGDETSPSVVAAAHDAFLEIAEAREFFLDHALDRDEKRWWLGVQMDLASSFHDLIELRLFLMQRYPECKSEWKRDSFENAESASVPFLDACREFENADAGDWPRCVVKLLAIIGSVLDVRDEHGAPSGFEPGGVEEYWDAGPVGETNSD